MAAPVKITDTILRDAHQSLIATRMRTEDMLPICERLDRVGFWSLEVWGGATFDACLRFLREDPWERLRRLREALPNTRLQMLLRGQNLLGYRHYADDVVDAFVRRSAANGIDVFRIFDALNDRRNLERAIAAVKTTGKHAQGAISYTVSPVHTVDHFVRFARELETMGCDSIAIKDMSGLLTPMVTRRLVTALREHIGVPLHLHSHATAGVAELCHWEAIQQGCSHVDTAISAFAGGASHPPTESLVAALRETPYDSGLDLELLQEIGFYFREVRTKYRAFESEFTGLDTRVQTYQVPGGMISNLSLQLKEQGALNRFGEVLQEIPRVREDLGYPPLVTPTSQIVGAQAVLNVLTETRYKTISNEVKQYFKGYYGRPPAPVNPLIHQMAIGNEAPLEGRPADALGHELDELRREIDSLAHGEEDVLTFALFPEIGRAFLTQRQAGTLQPEATEPLVETDTADSPVPVEFNITLHGETYHVKLTGTGHKRQAQRPFYMTVDGIPEEIMVESLEELDSTEGAGTGEERRGSHRPRATKPGHVTPSMPGSIVDVLVSEGQTVQAGDPLLVTEAMKMETEIQAPLGGTVHAVYVQKGDRVNPDETLVEIR
jgi:pyruvate carboxylase subunit B